MSIEVFNFIWNASLMTLFEIIKIANAAVPLNRFTLACEWDGEWECELDWVWTGGGGGTFITCASLTINAIYALDSSGQKS